MVADHGRRWRKRERRAHKRDPVLFKELFNTSDIRTGDAGLGNHERLMPIANVVPEEYALVWIAWFDEEHRLRPLDNDDHDPGVFDDETVSPAQDRASW
jgi:hypothetical protein